MNSAWQRLTRTVAPTMAASSLPAAKDHLRVDHEADDPLIEALIDAAAAMIEGPNGLGIALTTQTWRLVLDGYLPAPLELPLGPVIAVTGITYVDPDGDTRTLDPELYTVRTDRQPAVIDRVGDYWPPIRRQLSAVAVTFTAGFGATAADVPADLRAAMLLMIGHLYHNREAVTTARAGIEMPLGFDALASRYRVGRFG